MIMHDNHVCHSADGLQTSRGESIRYVSPGGLNEQRTKKGETVKGPHPFLRPRSGGRGSAGPFSSPRATVDNWNRTHELVASWSAPRLFGPPPLLSSSPSLFLSPLKYL